MLSKTQLRALKASFLSLGKALPLWDTPVAGIDDDDSDLFSKAIFARKSTEAEASAVVEDNDG